MTPLSCVQLWPKLVHSPRKKIKRCQHTVRLPVSCFMYYVQTCKHRRTAKQIISLIFFFPPLSLLFRSVPSRTLPSPILPNPFLLLPALSSIFSRLSFFQRRSCPGVTQEKLFQCLKDFTRIFSISTCVIKRQLSRAIYSMSRLRQVAFIN